MTIERREEQQQNLRAAEALYTAFSQEDLATLVRLLDEQVEVEVHGSAEEARSYKGHKGFGQWYQSAGGHRRQVTDVSAVGKSGIVVASPDGADLLEFDDGKVVALHLHPSKDEAVKAAEKFEAEHGDG